jgi:2-keto-4-pentenoate hydratase/2-oxohepta-3-ene-1,7-dioic acid hydratase in catechol pathway
MRLASVRAEHGTVLAAVVGEEVVDLGRAAPELPGEMSGLLAQGAPALERVRQAIASGEHRTTLTLASLAPPITRPGKFLAVGLNYADHIAETGQDTPEFPTVFAKMSTSVAGPFDDVQRPYISDKLDYEGELGFVIGRRCRHVPRELASEVIAGYVVINDYSVRDVQLRTSQWVLGKSFDTHGVIGPWIVTTDELDPHALPIRTLVNGEIRQESNTSNLIFDCFDQVALLSSICTLEPGDVIATGTPAGVGMASDRYLVPGDRVRVEIDGIGAIENRIVQEVTPDLAAARPATGAGGH